MSKDRFALWFMPAQPYYDIFGRLINQFADTWASTPFPPHLTGYSGSFNHLSREWVLHNMEQIPRFSLKCTGLAHSSNYFKTFYLTLQQGTVMEKVIEKLNSQLKPDLHYKSAPHISLIYKDLREAQRESLLDGTALPCKEVVFDQIWLVQPKDPRAGWRNIEDLKYLKKIRLRV